MEGARERVVAAEESKRARMTETLGMHTVQNFENDSAQTYRMACCRKKSVGDIICARKYLQLALVHGGA